MKLSELKYTTILFDTSDEDIEKIVYRDNLLERPSDIGIVLGGLGMIPNRVDAGIELYKKGLVKKLILSGGIGYLNKDREHPEAFKMLDYALSQGMAGDDVIAEAFSRNTLENMDNSLEIIKGVYLHEETSFTVVTSDFHLRRSMELLISILGNRSNVQGLGVKDGITDIDSWRNSLAGRKQLIMEALLLSYYARHEKIADLEVGSLSLKRTK